MFGRLSLTVPLCVQVQSWCVHERLLPLWFVRTFEERLRRMQQTDVRRHPRLLSPGVHGIILHVDSCCVDAVAFTDEHKISQQDRRSK